MRVEKMAAMGEMAAGLAHELKNPIASLRGAIQILREDFIADPDQDRLMRIILRETDRLSTIATNFLLYAKPPTVRKEEAVELKSALEETLELFEKDSNLGKEVVIEKKFRSGLWIAMDRGHLKQVLWNLLLNAAESLGGQGRISIVLHSSKKNTIANIMIADTGCGMSNEIIQSIFSPFFTTKPNGNGLGLSIVHNILESYGSRMNVESREKTGTRVFLQFTQISALK